MTQFDLEDIQGNIIDGYRLPHVTHLFGAMNEPHAWRAFLHKIQKHVTRSTSYSHKPSVTLNIGLGFNALVRLAPGVAPNLRSHFTAYSEGMPRRGVALGDDAEVGIPWQTRDIWLSVHGATADDVMALTGHLHDLAASAQVKLEDPGPPGHALLSANGRHWEEHFGFRDDISYPAIADWPRLKPAAIPGRGKQLEDGSWVGIAAGEFLLGYEDEASDNKLNRLDPGTQALLRNGTFGVVRQLRQDVLAFREYTATMAARSGLSVQLLEAKMMGRSRDGTPVGGQATELSDFTYQGDEKGARCPLGAHVRRSNPRRDGQHRLLRRGMTFGKPLEGLAKDEERRGLWFVAFNASIEEQFEFIQRQWLNGPAGKISNSRDPIVGSEMRNMVIEGSVAQGQRPLLLMEMPKFVHSEGGQYYFMPSLSALQDLSAPQLQSSPPPPSTPYTQEAP